jgi:hypothetical protein
VALPHLFGLVAELQPVERILAHRLQHAVARLATILAQLRQDQRLLDQPPEQIEHVFGVRLLLRAHRLGSLERQTSGEYRQSPE